MPARTKTTVVGTALVLLTLWPLVHIGLVKRYGISPWKPPAGACSAPRLGMEIFGRRARAAEPPRPAVRDEAYLERHAGSVGWCDRRRSRRSPRIRVARGQGRRLRARPRAGDRMVVMDILVHRYAYGRGRLCGRKTRSAVRGAAAPVRDVDPHGSGKKYVNALSNAAAPISAPAIRPLKSSLAVWMPPNKREIPA